jgi:hypothetical protein
MLCQQHGSHIAIICSIHELVNHDEGYSSYLPVQSLSRSGNRSDFDSRLLMKEQRITRHWAHARANQHAGQVLIFSHRKSTSVIRLLSRVAPSANSDPPVGAASLCTTSRRYNLLFLISFSTTSGSRYTAVKSLVTPLNMLAKAPSPLRAHSARWLLVRLAKWSGEGTPFFHPFCPECASLHLLGRRSASRLGV